MVRKGQVVEQDDIADAGKVRMVNLALDAAPVARLRELAQSTRDWKTHARQPRAARKIRLDVCGTFTLCRGVQPGGGRYGFWRDIHRPKRWF